jgi:hypothetical protein
MAVNVVSMKEAKLKTRFRLLMGEASRVRSKGGRRFTVPTVSAQAEPVTSFGVFDSRVVEHGRSRRLVVRADGTPVSDPAVVRAAGSG